MGAGVVDDQQIAHVDLGQHPVHRKFVVVLAQGPGNVVLVVAGGVLLTHDGDVVVGPIHGGPHQVGCAGVHPDVLLVDVLLMDGLRHQAAVRPKHIAA